MSWTKIPLSLRVAIIAMAFAELLQIAVGFAEPSSFAFLVRVQFGVAGMHMVWIVFAAHAALDLSRGATGPSGTGLRLAATGFVLQFMTSYGWYWLEAAKPDLMSPETFAKVVPWSDFGFVALALGGLALAAAQRNPLAWVGALAAAVKLPPVAEQLAKAMPSHPYIAHQFGDLIVVVATGLLAATFAAGRGGEPVRDVARASLGLRRSSSSLWMRVVGTLGALALLLLLLVAEPRDEGWLKIMKYAVIGGQLLAVASFVVLAVGMLDVASAGVTDVSALGSIIGAGTALWSAGIQAIQLPYAARGGFFGGGLDEVGGVFSYAQPILAIGCVAVCGAVIGGLGNRRMDSNLAHAATGRTFAWVILNFVFIASILWWLKTAKSKGELEMILFVAIGANVAATVTMAKLFQMAADVVEREAGLPPARIVV
jgi:hypothetical protein